MRARTWVGAGIAGLVVVVVVVAVVAVAGPWRDDARRLPVAEGRASDACSGRGNVGLVGYDLRTGEQLWTNVVGEDAQNVWTPGPDGDVTSGDNDHAFVIDGSGHVRAVEAVTGAVDRCTTVAELAPEEVGRPIAVDESGAYAVEEVLHRVEVREAEGTPRWQLGKRQLVGASKGGVVVWTNPQTTCCDDTGPQDLAVLDPATSKTRWAGGDPSGVLAVTDDHILAMSTPNEVSDIGPRGERDWTLTALDITDGSEVWHLDRRSYGISTIADAGQVVLSSRDLDGTDRITVIVEADGRERWSAAVPHPGQGGTATEDGGVLAAAVAGDVLVVAVLSTEPHRD